METETYLVLAALRDLGQGLPLLILRNLSKMLTGPGVLTREFAEITYPRIIGTKKFYSSMGIPWRHHVASRGA